MARLIIDLPEEITPEEIDDLSIAQAVADLLGVDDSSTIIVNVEGGAVPPEGTTTPEAGGAGETAAAGAEKAKTELEKTLGAIK